MQPFKKWLSSVTQAERIYSSLIKNNPSFVEYIDRQQISSREMMGTTGGFREFFAEPFQRISRYGLMIDRAFSTFLSFFSREVTKASVTRSYNPTLGSR